MLTAQRIAVVLGAAALVAAMAGATPAVAAANVAVQSLATTAAQQQAVRDYWTPARIAAIPTDPEQPVDAPLQNTPDGASWQGGSGVRKTVGRLFFVDRGEDASCTATVVDSANHSTVVTAGHCVHSLDLIGQDPQWTDKPFFVPGFHDGSLPYGGFVAKYAVADTRWVADDQRSQYDEAFLVLNPGTDGRTVQDTVGAAQHLGLNVPGGVPVTEFGYPRAAKQDGHRGRPEFMGQRVARCRGTAVQAAALSTGPGDTDTIPLPPGQWGVPCDMGGGSSGGPRIANLHPTGLGTVIGVDTLSSYLDATGKPCTAPTPCHRYLVGTQFTPEVTAPLYTAAAHTS